ncbi:endonuclease/exonuclease/phosphatase family protein [Streptococcus pyogenes]|uniref:endonuclease/exonuclease/phosphatase family protein n=1 Tax=Streptococcus pyogenes TaxID=1314 RepID=UPI0010A1CA42|nr:SpnA family nuclease [Streptococcus pyogenes]VGU94116.1 LPXTG-motif cell wall anchor domain-containing protein [Streptococcus pyogenes]VGU94607.1 LPXTG-motif cell wall anchor domain-containing protein [Streptococcus pyogenes]VGV26085.1 LPXTG-motif cell wall anchor domain-containing protein [Streptococcus pyogenes]VHA95220.1 LPXTG-motif cell wall anchor domain-containing protein [Streptococcus pyogenes]VHB93342.1 LPXTG-motif cell wall anchor domain-containing protein [Streptococcus pyogenes]
MINKKCIISVSLLTLAITLTSVEEVTSRQNLTYANEIVTQRPKRESVISDKSNFPVISPYLASVDFGERKTSLPTPDKGVKVTTEQSIAQVRKGPEERTYTVTGKIMSVINGWGGYGFYIQDSEGIGLYVYPQKDLGYSKGDIVQLTGTLTRFKGDLQLQQVTAHKKLELSFPTSVKEAVISELETTTPSTLVKLSHVTVGELSTDQYNNTSFLVRDDSGKSIVVHIDHRTGVKGADVVTKISQGDLINLTAILSIVDGQLQLRPFSLEQLEVVKKVTSSNSDASSRNIVKIGEIQGASHTSPLLKKAVTVEQVVVTYLDDSTHFYVQDLNGDGDLATSDGIRVFAKNAKVQVGDVLTISGEVEEFFGRGYEERKQTDLTITQIVAKAVTKTGTAQVPSPLVLGKDRIAPVNIIDNDGLRVFDPEEDAIDYWESMEGMLVAVDDAKILGPMKNKEIYVLPGSSTRPLNNSGGVLLPANSYNTDVIPVLFKKGKQIIKAGDSYKGRLAGPVSYSYGNYKVFVDDSKNMPSLMDGHLKPEKTNLQKDLSKLSIASYNIENFSANPSSTKDEKVKRIAESFIHDLNAPDIIGLIEVQDNNGPTDDGTTDATQSAQRLIDAIKKLGGPTYRYVDIAPENNVDGGQPGGNIRTGFLYQPERVSLSDKPKGGARDALTWVNGELNLSVGRIDPTNAAWKDVRKSLAAEFIFQGRKVVVVANHLNSKRGDNALYGRVQPVTFKSEQRRHVLANMLAQFAKEGAKHQANIVMLGDFNDFEFTKTIQLIEEGDMVNLVSRHDISDRYSYFHQGNNQTLDNILVSRHLLDHYEFDMVHVNSPFMEAHGRASDHDPLLLQLSFPKENDKAESSKQSVKAKKTSKGKLLPKTGDSLVYVITLLGTASLLVPILLLTKGKKES